MKPSHPTQFGVRENTASSRQNASRLTLDLPSSRRTSVVDLVREEADSEIGKTEPYCVPTGEPFVSADRAAQFLSVKRRYLLELARREGGILTLAYSLS
jgi:hypothetical protein